MTSIKKSNVGIEIKGWSDSKGRQWNVSITTTTIDGRKEPVGIHIYSNESIRLTQSTIREIPFAEFLQDRENFPHDFVQRRSGITGAMSVEPKRSRGSQRLSEYELKEVAEIYTDAFFNHLPVQKTVAQTLGIPLSTACKRINLVRKKGLLPRVERPNRKIAGSEPEGN